MTTAEQFFYDNAGYSHDPQTETEKEGHKRSAKMLADAEIWATANGVFFDWWEDPEHWDGDEPWDGKVWGCSAYRYEQDDDAPLASLGGIAMAQDLHDPYRRVIEAELALEIQP